MGRALFDTLLAGRAMRQHVMDSKDRTLRNNGPQASAAAKAPAGPHRKVTHA